MHLVLKATSFQSASMGADAEKVFDERGGSFGRSQASDWVLPDPERYISGQHGRVFFEEGRYFVTDTSTNGLVIEGQSEPIGKGNSAPLNHGDVLLLGEFRLQVNIEDEGVATSIVVEPEDDLLLQPTLDGSLDPLDFVPAASSSAGDPAQDWPTSQADDSSMPSDHFQVPGVDNDRQMPSFEPPPTPVQAPPEPAAPAESPAAMVEDILESTANGELIGDDWDVTDYGRNQRQPKAGAVRPQPVPPPPTADIPEQDSLAELPPSATPEPPVPEAPPPECAAEAPFVEQDNPAAVENEPVAPRSVSPADESALYQAFLEGLGVADNNSPEAGVEAMRRYGQLLRQVIASLIDLLNSRAGFKNEFRMNRTVIRPVENNPLKFSPNSDEALRIFFSSASSGYLDMESSIRGGLTDMKIHQFALAAGLQAIFNEFSSMMQPERYTAESADGVRALLQSMTQKSRNWDQFCAYCERLDQESASGISGHFSEVFANAYEEKIIMLGDIDGG